VGASVTNVGVLDKAVVILGALEAAPRNLAELVEVTGISRATAHRLATALVHHGLARRDPDGRFVLGSRLVELGRAAAAAFPLAGMARPALVALRDATGESVQLYVRDGDRRVCVASLESPHGLRTIVGLGATLPLSAGSAGRLLRGDPEALARGWAQSVGEREAGVASVSAPVCDETGTVVAAVSVSGPVGRTGDDPGPTYGPAVRAAADELSARLTG
jgi:DNA-binding IclR family transcriptional regulator